MRPIPIFAVALLASFFMAWFTLPIDPRGGSPFAPPQPRLETKGDTKMVYLSMTGLDLVRNMDAFISIAKSAPGNKDLKLDSNGLLYFWAMPVLAAVTILSGGAGTAARFMAVISGLYPLAWIGYAYWKIPAASRDEVLKSLGDHAQSVLGVGIYVALVSALALLFLGISGKWADADDESA